MCVIVCVMSLFVISDRNRANSGSKETSSSKESSGKDISMVRIAGEGGVTEEVTEKGGVLYEKKDNSLSCRDCGNVFSIANSAMKALIKLER